MYATICNRMPTFKQVFKSSDLLKNTHDLRLTRVAENGIECWNAGILHLYNSWSELFTYRVFSILHFSIIPGQPVTTADLRLTTNFTAHASQAAEAPSKAISVAHQYSARRFHRNRHPLPA